MYEMDFLDHIPTDEEIIYAIKSIKLDLEFFENLLKLNESGRREALIYVFGMLHFPEYRYTPKRRISEIRKGQGKELDFEV